MADTMQFDLVSPERRLVSVQAREVQIPAAEGDMTAMANHEPTITSLRPGVLIVHTADGAEKYLVTGGFAEITAEGTTVLAERAHHVDEVTKDMIDSLVADAQKAHQDAHPDVADVTAKLLSDMVAAGEHIGLDPQQPSL
ncbi:MAG: F0F1 ATP synthase subunit epsilon [Confluentimicrobium sp.]|nr:F0F1 ATP synthase subunit epsilon [Actibacterium sp.]|tara:strand:- start:267 stop:686 length:420 start_codon:yes stop_codon:yes gene_type:complete